MSMKDKIVVITGANSGIGYAAAEECVRQGAGRVIVAGRDAGRVAAAAQALGPSAVGEVVDVSSPASIDAFVARCNREYPQIDILINNAGVFIPPHSKTAEGFEVTLATNVIGCAYLTYALLPKLTASATARIVTLSSFLANSTSESALAARMRDIGGLHETETTSDIYNQSKALVTLWGQALQLRLRASPATAHILVASCDPGLVLTAIQTKTQSSLYTSCASCWSRLTGKTSAQGAVPVVFCATSGEVAAHGGAMWSEGPRVRLMELKSYFTAANRDLAFETINKAIEGMGRKAF